MTSIGDSSELGEVGGMDQEQNPEGESMERADSIENIESTGRPDSTELEEATLEPDALIEAQRDFTEAEAIETAFTELVDASQESSAEEGKGALGQGSFDPSQQYSGVEMAEGEVLVDQDWNEGANAPPTEETAGAGESLLGSADADDRPLEEIIDGGEMMGYAKSVKGGTAKAELATHQLGEEDIQRKGSSTVDLESPPGGPGMDYKPIPAEEGVIHMDGKGGDLTDDREVKFDTAEGVIPKIEAEEGVIAKLDLEEGALPKLDVVKGEVDPVEGGGGLVDFKFFKVENKDEQEGSLIAKDPAYLEAEGIRVSQTFEAALGRAVTDPAFRHELLEDAQGALADYELSAEEIALLGQIDPDGLQQVAEQIRSQFENLEDPAAQTILGRIIADVLSGGSGVVKGE